MRLRIKFHGLCCANCAAKIEQKVLKLSGVQDAALSFISEKMTVTADDAKAEEIKIQIEKTVKKIEPNVKIEYV